MRKKVLQMLTIIFSLFVLFNSDMLVKAEELPFNDVKESDWFYSGVAFVYQEGLMAGMGDGTYFAPHNELERAQFAAVLYRQAGSPEVEYDGRYPDVEEGTWYTSAVAWAGDAKIVSGYANGCFGPSDNISREQMAVMMYRYAKYIECDVSKTADFEQFQDAGNVSSYAEEAMKWAVGNGIVSGKTGNVLDPQGSATRAECASILSRFRNVLDSDGNGGDYTRGEWIGILMEHLGWNIEDAGEIVESYYSDIQGTEYQNEIETAKALGILPDSEEEEPRFEPDKKATREFAAMTVSNAMGYQGTYAFECKDASELKYPNEVAAVVINGYMNLEEEKFNPKRGLKTEDANLIFGKIDEMNAEVQEIPEEVQSIEYQKEVVAGELTQNTDYTVEEQADGRYKVTMPESESTAQISEGKVFVLPANDAYYSGWALKAESIQRENAVLIIIASRPESISDVFEAIEISGKGQAVKERIETSDGVEATFETDATAEADAGIVAYGNLIDAEGTTDGSETLNLVIKEKKLSEYAKLSGNIKLHIPSIGYKLDADFDKKDGIQVNELLLTVNNRLDVEGQFDCEFQSSWSWDSANKHVGNVELCRIPIALGNPSLTFDLVFYYNYDIKGKAGITYNLETVTGLQVKNGTIRYISDYRQKCDLTMLQGDGKAGLKIAGQLTAFYIWNMIGIDGEMGLGFNGSAEYHEETGVDPLLCIDGKMHVYGSLGLDEDTLIVEFLQNHLDMPLSWQFWDENTSRLKGAIHFENGVKVNECTYGKETVALLFKGVLGRDETEDIKVTLTDTEGNKSEYLGTDTSSGILVKSGEYTVVIDSISGLYKQQTRTIQVNNKEHYREEIQLETIFAGGDGSKENPFQIADANQLDKLRYSLDGYYIQTEDIDLSGYECWEPIGYWEGSYNDGNYSYAFKGGYDGNGYEIVNMTINRNDHWGHLNHPSGLFGYYVPDENKCIQNIKLSNVYIYHIGNQEYEYDDLYVIGGIVGEINCISTEWKIKNCMVQGNITMQDNVNTELSTIVGGVVGINYSTGIYGCVSQINIISNMHSSTLGGIVGSGYQKIEKCINEGNIMADSVSDFDNEGNCKEYVSGICGGIAGTMIDAEVAYCVNRGNVSCVMNREAWESKAGGIAGEVNSPSEGIIHDCVNYGTISAITDNMSRNFEPKAGGIIGYTYSGCVTDCYHAGENVIAQLLYDENNVDNDYHPKCGYAGRIIGMKYEEGASENYVLNDTKLFPSILIQKEEMDQYFGDDGTEIVQEEFEQKSQYILDRVAEQ